MTGTDCWCDDLDSISTTIASLGLKIFVVPCASETRSLNARRNVEKSVELGTPKECSCWKARLWSPSSKGLVRSCSSFLNADGPVPSVPSSCTTWVKKSSMRRIWGDAMTCEYPRAFRNHLWKVLCHP